MCLWVLLKKSESELKLLEKQADDCLSRQIKHIQTATKLAETGVSKYKDFASEHSRYTHLEYISSTGNFTVMLTAGY